MYLSKRSTLAALFFSLALINLNLFSNKLLSQERIIEILSEELQSYLENKSKEKLPPYFLSCRVDDITKSEVTASFGKVETHSSERVVAALPEIRVGSPQFDNFHNNNSGSARTLFIEPEPLLLPLDKENRRAIINILREELDSRYRYAVASYNNFASAKGLKSSSSDLSSDFTPVLPAHFYQEPIDIEKEALNIEEAKEFVRELSSLFCDYPLLLKGSVSLRQEIVRKYFISTEGSRITQNLLYNYLYISAEARADDGMALPLTISYFALSKDGFPSKERLINEIHAIANKTIALREAPIVDPYTGPALLSGAASGVFFHEIFGHRIEGQKMKSDYDGQTFKKMVGSQILPKSISVYDDPTIKLYGGVQLSGFYHYDDQGVEGERVVVVEDGILRNFLMTRTAIEGFESSNGHARAQIAYDPTSRQSNLIVESSNLKSEEELRALLIKEAIAQGKEYAYFFKDVSGGYTITGRSSPNAFNVTPIEVYKVFIDGSPDQLVRGVDLIGTPLSMFSNIIEAGGEIEVFNGMCGAASGRVPVSALSPALLVSKIELQKKPYSANKPPILSKP